MVEALVNRAATNNGKGSFYFATAQKLMRVTGGSHYWRKTLHLFVFCFFLCFLGVFNAENHF